MTDSAAFSEQEWDTVQQGPTSAGVVVMTAERGGTFRESFAMARAYADARQEHGESELLDALVSSRPEMDRTRAGSPEELRERALRNVRDAVALVERKATPEELTDYREFVLTLSRRVAEAKKERGGSGVSESERAAIEEIRSALGA
jgi:hypothetical protein